MSLSTFRLDPRGDLTLRLGPDGATEDYIVCPRTLARTSPVFERMLYGNFAEGNSSARGAASEWIVRLPEDKPVTMGRFLSIIHGNYDDSLRNLSLDEIYDLTITAHYYDAIQFLRPWVEVWISRIGTMVEKVNTPMLKVLWIAWELGAIALFQTASRYILLEFDAADFEDALSCDGGQPPHNVLEHIYAVRENILYSMLQPFRDLVDKLLVEDEKPRWCRHAVWMGPHRCESIILGSLTWGLCKAKLWPLPDEPEVQDSIAALYTRLSTLIIHDLGKFEEAKEDHSICNPSGMITSQMQSALDHLRPPMTEKHREYMAKQQRARVKEVPSPRTLLNDTYIA